MENVSIVIVDKSFNVQNLQGLVIRSEEYANKIKIQFPKTYEGEDLTGKIFILKCTNANGVYFETLLPKTITAEYIELLWTVTAEFTTVSGVLKIAIFAESANYSLGTKMSKVIVEESPQYSIPIDDFTVLESYMTEIRVAADEVERDRAEALDSKNIAVAAKNEAVAVAVPASVTAVDARNIAVTAKNEAVAARNTAVTAADDAVARMAAYEGGAIAVQVETNTSAIGQNTSDLNAHKAENLQQLSMGIGSIPYGEIKLPTDFINPSFDLWRDNTGKIQHNFDLEGYENGTKIYCDSSVPSDGGDGTINSPKKYLYSAITLAQNGVDSHYTILCKSARIDRGFGLNETTISGKKIAIIPDVSNLQNKIIMSAHYKELSWVTDNGVWKSARSSVVNVYDLNNTDLYGVPIPFKRVYSLAECVALVGSWYADFTSVWVNTLDGIEPNDTRYVIGVVNPNFEPTLLNGAELYIKNAIILHARTITSNRVSGDPTGVTDSTFIANNCIFGGNTQNGLSILDIKRTYLFNCISAYSGEDGFNYHYQLDNGLSSLAFEYNCKSYRNGVNSLTNTSNATTCHDKGRILRIGSIGYETKGPLLADVDGCYSVLYDCHMRDSLLITGSLGIKAAYQFYGVGSKAIMVNCDGGGDVDYSIHIPSSFDITLQAFRGFKFSDGFNPKVIS